MEPAVPSRVRWAVELLEPAAHQQLLEVGGGPGVSAALICRRLTSGTLLAVDRSAVAIDRSSRRNAAHVAAGRLRHEQQELADLVLEPASLDQVLCLDVNLFWTRQPTAELDVLRAALRPGGRLLVLYGAGAPPARARVLTAVGSALSTNGFTDVVELSADDGFGVIGHVGEA